MTSDPVWKQKWMCLKLNNVFKWINLLHITIGRKQGNIYLFQGTTNIFG